MWADAIFDINQDSCISLHKMATYRISHVGISQLQYTC